MGVMVNPSLGRVVSSAASSSGLKVLTVLPCGNMVSLSQDTVFHELLQLAQLLPWAAVLPAMDCSSVGRPQSHSWPSSGSALCSRVCSSRNTGRILLHCSSIMASTTQPEELPFTTGWRETAVFVYLVSFFTDLGVSIVVFPMSHSSPKKKQKKSSQKKGTCPTVFSTLMLLQRPWLAEHWPETGATWSFLPELHQ